MPELLTFFMVIAKLIGRWFGGKAGGFAPVQSTLMGAAMIPHLSTTLAVIFTGFGLELIGEEFVAIMVMTSIVTTVIGPMLVNIPSGMIRKRARAPVPAEILTPKESSVMFASTSVLLYIIFHTRP